VREDSRRAIEARLRDDDLVLDVGAWAHPFPRADWVIDLMPYATRGLYHYDRDAVDERFTADTWVQRDVCDRGPWPFADDQFAFAVCSHTLEDLRDPVWVCAELSRVARAGYVECPSRAEEQAPAVEGPWAGRSHHRWLIERDEATGGLTFVFKHHVLDFDPRLQAERPEPGDRELTVFWEGELPARELVFTDDGELKAWLREVAASGSPERRRRGLLRRHR